MVASPAARILVTFKVLSLGNKAISIILQSGAHIGFWYIQKVSASDVFTRSNGFW